MPIVRLRLLPTLALSLGVHAGLLALGRFQAPPAPPPAVQAPLQVELKLARVQPVKPSRPAVAAPLRVEKHKPARMPACLSSTAP